MFAGIGSSSWAYPVLEIVHLFGIALLLGNLVLLEARVFGFGPTLDIGAVARLSLAIALAGFGLAAASGLLMFATQPGELLANRAFQLKMALLLLAGCNAAAFHARGSLAKLDRVARLQLVLSLAMWLAILSCGRWIAYL